MQGRSHRRSTGAVAFLDMLGVFAEFETNLRRERQLRLGLVEGYAATKVLAAAPGARQTGGGRPNVRLTARPGLIRATKAAADHLDAKAHRVWRGIKPLRLRIKQIRKEEDRHG